MANVYTSTHTGAQLDNFLSQAGGTMTGNLKTNNKSVYIVSSIDNDNPPTGETLFSSGILAFRDKNDDYNLGWLQLFSTTAGYNGLRISGRKVISGSKVNNYIDLKVGPNGEKEINVSSPAAWQNELNIVPSTGGTYTGNVTFNGSINFANTNDASPTNFNTPPALTIGNTQGQHLEMDTNEIMSKSGTATLGKLYLQDQIVFSENYMMYRSAISSNYIQGREHALIRLTYTGGYGAVASLATKDGSWEIGHYDSDTQKNRLQFVYGTNTNFNNNSNTVVIAYITPAGAFTNASKREYKDNIKLIDYPCLDIVNSVQVCSFTMKGDPDKDYRVGFIADDTDPILSGKYQDVMDIQNCIGVMMKAIQELNQEVNELKQQIGD